MLNLLNFLCITYTVTINNDDSNNIDKTILSIDKKCSDENTYISPSSL